MADSRPVEDGHEEDHRGTLFVVLTIGVIMLVVWFAVYLLFLSRY